MAISGYAGRALRDVPLYGGGGSSQRYAAGPKGPGMSDTLRRGLEMKQRLAEAQLAMLQEDLSGSKQQQNLRQRAYEARAREARRQENRSKGKPFALGAVDPMEEIKKLLASSARRGSEKVTDWESYSDVGSAKGMTALLGGVLGGDTGKADLDMGRGQSGGPQAMAAPAAGVGTARPDYQQSFGQGREDYQPNFRSPIWNRLRMEGLMSQGKKPLNPNVPAYRNPSTIPSREAGGAIPETGPYKLHKGEEVIPADVAGVIRRKLNDRTKVLGSYQEGTFGDITVGDLFGKAKSFGDITLGDLLEKLKLGKAGKLPSYLQQKGAEGIGSLSGGIESLGEEIEELRKLQPGIYGSMEAIGELPEGSSLSRRLGAASRGAVGGYLSKPELPSASEFVQGLVGPGDALLGGLQTPQEPAPAAPSGPPEEPGPPPADLASALPPEGSYEAAVARVRGGDFGSREDPLTLHGELSDIEQAQRDTEKMPMYQEAKRKAEKAELEANRIYTMLEKEGAAMPPDQYQSLFQEADRKMKLSDKFQGILERKEKASDAFLASSNKMTQGIVRDLLRAKMVEDRMKHLQEMRQDGRLSMQRVRGWTSSLPGLYKQAVGENPNRRALAQVEITNILQGIAAYHESLGKSGFKEMGEGASGLADQFINLPEDQVQGLVDRLVSDLSAQGAGPGSASLAQALGGLQ